MYHITICNWVYKILPYSHTKIDTVKFLDDYEDGDLLIGGS